VSPALEVKTTELEKSYKRTVLLLKDTVASEVVAVNRSFMTYIGSIQVRFRWARRRPDEI